MIKFDVLLTRMDYYVHKYVCLYKNKYNNTGESKELKKATLIELGILNLIEWEPNISIKDIGHKLGTRNSTLTSAIDRLEKKDILHRTIHPEDKRSFRLVLTEKGKQVVDVRIAEKKEMFRQILLALDNDEERELLIGLLEKIYKNLSKNE